VRDPQREVHLKNPVIFKISQKAAYKKSIRIFTLALYILPEKSAKNFRVIIMESTGSKTIEKQSTFQRHLITLLLMTVTWWSDELLGCGYCMKSSYNDW
jgi:hypothetical protein